MSCGNIIPPPAHDALDIPPCPYSLQVDPTTAHLAPLIGPCPRGLIVSIEDESDVPEGFLAAITSQTNSNIFVPAVMLGPLNTMRTMPGIAHNPILRSISYIAGIADVSALLCAVVLRARMYYLKRRGRSERFAEVSGQFSSLTAFVYRSSSNHPPLIHVKHYLVLSCG
ncbi:hypothetical protein BC629DRAFT_630367 [Irpex lacteus]|nr:hypothetical protein BC629DRAFT_630367 [Irpex lacteus]